MTAVFVVIANVVSKKSFQMALVESDDVIEQIAAAASYPALSDSVLPGTSNGGSQTGDPHRADSSGNFQSVLRVVIEEEKLGSGVIGKCFAQLLDDPMAGRMPGDVEVQDAPPVMANDEKAIEQLERSGHGFVWKFSSHRLAFALCRAWPNTIGIPPCDSPKLC